MNRHRVRSCHAAERTLASAGCPESDARWLAALLVQVLPRGDSDDSNQGAADDGPLGSVSMVWPYTKLAYVGFSSAGVDLEALAQVSDSTYRDSGLLATLAALMGELYAPRIEVPDRAPDDETWAWSIGEHEAVKVAQAMLARGADFRTLLMQGWPPILVKELLGSPIDSKREREKRVCRVLVLAGAIEQGLADTLTAPYPQSVLQAVSDEQEARAAPQPAPHRADAKPLDEEAIARAASNLLTGSFDYYLSCYREPEHREIARRIVQGTLDDLREMTALAAQAGDTQFASIVGVIADAASARWANSEHGRLFDIYAGHAPMWQEHMLAFARDMRPYFELADARVGPRPTDASHELRSVWMLLFRMSWDAESVECPSKLRDRMLAAANEDVSRMRPLLASAVSEGDTPQAREFVAKVDHFRRCCSLLAFHGGLWRMFKPVILALRALKTRAVAHDLRDWPEFVDDPPPEPWRAIPGVLKDVFHATIGREQESDVDLERLRRDFGAFCLERLTDRLKAKQREEAARTGAKRRNEDMKEPSPEWRYAYVRAVSALRVNPGGKGHRTLHIAAKLDPDERVRDAARDAELTIRHARRLPDRVSPRRAVLKAVWWLKQAHMRELGEMVDADLAQRTQAKELTRTKVVLARDIRPAQST